MTEIARAAGCSQTAVSLILNHKPGFQVSLDLRQRVIAIAHDLGYGLRRPRGAASRGGSETAEAGAPASFGRVPSQAARVVREIGIAIVSDRFPPNTMLPRDSALLAHFGVSRTVLREALKVLAGKRLLLPRARIGTKVLDRSEWNIFDPDLLMWHLEAGIDENFIRHVGEIRWALEPEAAALAARRHRPQDVAILRAHAARMAEPGAPRKAFVAADLDFHIAVATASGNPFLRAISALIEVALVEAFTRSSPGDEAGGAARSAADHRAIVDAIAAGDEEAARAAMRVVVAEGILRASRP